MGLSKTELEGKMITFVDLQSEVKELASILVNYVSIDYFMVAKGLRSSTKSMTMQKLHR